MSEQAKDTALHTEGPATAELRRFEDLGLNESSLQAIARKGFEAPTRIQAEVIPLLLQGINDVIAQSHTGTGKTAAFGLPLIQMLEPARGPVQSLIMVPTRELAVQVAEEINTLRGTKPLHVVPIYGGQSYELQFRHLRQGVDILVGTPGRIIDHLNRGSLKLDSVRWVVLDEADEMLDMGFHDDIEAILGTCTSQKRMLLFSATMPHRIRSMAETWMRDMKEISVKSNALTTSNTEQTYMEVLQQDKFEALCRIIDHAPDFYGMVFGRTKVECDTIHRHLLERGYDAEVLHGDVNQTGREKVLDSFRKRNVDILVATDVAARGIDVEAISHVINYSLPSDSESYVHRIGRTGRAGREGRAITFITPAEFRKLSYIQRMAKSEIKRERPPRVDEILEQKRQRLSEELKNAISAGISTEDLEAGDGVVDAFAKTGKGDAIPDIFHGLAEDLMSHSREIGIEATEALARILHAKLAEDLDPGRYGSVTELAPGGKRPGGFERNDRGDRGNRDFGNRGFERGDRGFDRGNRDFGNRGDRDFGNRDSGNRDFGNKGDRDYGPPRERPAGGVRLYVARGKVDHFTKPKLVEFIRKGANVRDRDIDGVELYEFYSFITVPESEAEKIKSAFAHGGKDGKPIVRSAAPEEGNRSRKAGPGGFKKKSWGNDHGGHHGGHHGGGHGGNGGHGGYKGGSHGGHSSRHEDAQPDHWGGNHKLDD